MLWIDSGPKLNLKAQSEFCTFRYKYAEQLPSTGWDLAITLEFVYKLIWLVLMYAVGKYVTSELFPLLCTNSLPCPLLFFQSDVTPFQIPISGSKPVFLTCHSAVSRVVQTDLCGKKTKTEKTIKLSFCSVPNTEKHKRTWLLLISYVRMNGKKSFANVCLG